MNRGLSFEIGIIDPISAILPVVPVSTGFLRWVCKILGESFGTRIVGSSHGNLSPPNAIRSCWIVHIVPLKIVVASLDDVGGALALCDDGIWLTESILGLHVMLTHRDTGNRVAGADEVVLDSVPYGPLDSTDPFALVRWQLVKGNIEILNSFGLRAWNRVASVCQLGCLTLGFNQFVAVALVSRVFGVHRK